VSRAPTIDGRVSRDEWADCGAFAGYRNYASQYLDSQDVTTFCGYDAQALYLCFIVPFSPGQEPSARVTQHDGPVYKEDEVEVILLPQGANDIRQICVNAIGTVFDRRGKDRAWGGNWQIRVGRREHDWCMEMALPFSDLQVPTPRPGERWRVNFCVGGQRQRVLAPTFKSFLDRTKFATFTFLGPGSPSLRLEGLGRLTHGRLRFDGAARSSPQAGSSFRFSVATQMEGTKVVERTGYDEIVGALARLDRTVVVEAGESVKLDVGRPLDDPRLNQIAISVTARASAKAETLLYRTQARLSILPPLRLTAENYPAHGYLIGRIDATAWEGTIEGVAAKWRFLDAQGHAHLPGSAPLTSRYQSHRIDYRALAPGGYEWQVDLVRDGRTVESGKAAVERVDAPEWLGNDIGRSRIVLPPFTPMTYGGRQVGVWGRTMEWTAASILPARITSAGEPLLAAPMRIVVTQDGRDLPVTLEGLELLEQAPDRCRIQLSGRAGSAGVRARAWVEYDGLLWMDLEIEARDGQGVSIESPMVRDQVRYYHGVPDRDLTGAVKQKALEFPFQHYFWLGTCERGLGVCFESTRNLTLPESESFHYVVPNTRDVRWRIDLTGGPIRAAERTYSFGIQATPVRPLPRDWHSWLITHGSPKTSDIYEEFTPHVDFVTVWPRFKGPADEWMRNTFSNPMHDRADRIAPHVAWLHERGTPAILYHAPLNFSDDACPAHQSYQHEWMTGPRSRWKAYDFVQTRACARSSFADYLLFAFRKTVRAAKLDGLYFDGASSGPCTNRHHGCGWVDADGKTQPTWSIRANRELNKRVAVMLHEEVEPRAIDSLPSRARPGWPHWYNWVHISGAVCPPMLSFNTAYFCGEWFKGRIKRGVPYEDMLRLDTFRPRYLSPPWGVPNVFLPITREGGRRWTGGSQQTECILAYLLPHGAPLFARYLHPSVRRTIIRAMTDFGTRTATFHPAWRANSLIAMSVDDNPDVLLAGWEKAGRLLTVVANVGRTKARVKLTIADAQKVSVVHIFPVREGSAPRRVEDDSLTVDVPPLTFRMMVIDRTR